MRANKIIAYESILQVLGEPGCPLCRFMKNFQAALLQDCKASGLHHLCNFHTWGLAATQRASSVAELFITLLQERSTDSIACVCDICFLLQKEEDLRIREFSIFLGSALVAEWQKNQPEICIIHGVKLMHGAPQLLASTIRSITERYRMRLVADLTHLRDESQHDASKGGLIGHAAEFLVAQRGLRA